MTESKKGPLAHKYEDALGAEPQPPETSLTSVTRMFYDVQKLRIAINNRVLATDDKTVEGADKKAPRAKLPEEVHKKGLGWVEQFQAIEHDILLAIKAELKDHPVWRGFLEPIPGMGPTMAAVLLGGRIDIHWCYTPTRLARYCGLQPGQRRRAGERMDYNPFVRTKLLGVFGPGLLKACVRKTPQADECDKNGWFWHRIEYPWMEGPRWVKSYALLYFDRRHRRENQIGTCMLCEGAGQLVSNKGKIVPYRHGDIIGKATPKPCDNCDATGRGPWGRSGAHRQADAIRYMVRTFLIDFWEAWRRAEGLEVCEPYEVAYLGKAPHQGRAKWRKVPQGVEA